MSSFVDHEAEVEYARARWSEGEQSIQHCAEDSKLRLQLEQVVDALVQELEKRVGQAFSTLELARVQDSAEPWCMQIAHEVAPEVPDAWNLDIVQNAAFYRYCRRAYDYQLPT